MLVERFVLAGLLPEWVLIFILICFSTIMTAWARGQYEMRWISVENIMDVMSIGPLSQVPCWLRHKI